MSSNDAATEKTTGNGDGAAQDPFYLLGFDVGGTHTAAALAGPDGDLLAEAQAPTVRYEAQPAYADLFIRLRDELVRCTDVQPRQIRAAGVGVAGIVEPGTQRVALAPNLSSRDFDLRSIVEEALGIPTVVENDVNLAAVGEQRRGAACGCSNFIFVAIGTGIGSGIFIDGQLYRGTHHAAGEIGYMHVHGVERTEPEGLGAFERRASGPGLANAARQLLRATGAKSSLAPLDPSSLRSEHVWAAAMQGDSLAKDAISDMLDTLALGLANAAFILDPEMIVLGGGVSALGEALLHPLRERLHNLLVPPVHPRLELSALGHRAQLYGAIRQALGLAGSQADE